MKEHPTHKGYFVTEDGRVFSYWRLHHHTWLIDYNRVPKEISQCNGTKGYQLVPVAGGTRKVHRLVAETYLPNPHNYATVNHIDEDKKNNNVNNLEWMSNADNISYSHSKYYIIENLITNEVIKIRNLDRWCKENNLTSSNLRKTMGALPERSHHKNFRLINTQSHH
tara:strand:- start:1490 stop:1990 length:501 start_codon:yes stop_codon:yes gene_type:complete